MLKEKMEETDFKRIQIFACASIKIKNSTYRKLREITTLAKIQTRRGPGPFPASSTPRWPPCGTEKRHVLGITGTHRLHSYSPTADLRGPS